MKQGECVQKSMHALSTSFAKTLVWKHEYDVELCRHKQHTPNTNDYYIPLNETPMKIFCACHYKPVCSTGKSYEGEGVQLFNNKLSVVFMQRTSHRVPNVNNLICKRDELGRCWLRQTPVALLSVGQVGLLF